MIDPDKVVLKKLPLFFDKVHQSIATHIFVGGSTVAMHQTEQVVIAIKKLTNLPIFLFPGDEKQLTNKADGILFLSLLSGRNPTYLIEQQIAAVPFLKKSTLEIIATGYILIDGQKVSAVQKVSNTKPIAQEHSSLIVDTAVAGEYLGKKLVYLEAGSGAKTPVKPSIIRTVKNNISIPLIVGGGIRSKKQLKAAFDAGADLVVIGTSFEEDEGFFNQIKK